MPLDPQAKAVMEQLAALGFPPAHTVSPQEARANNRAGPRAKGPEVGRVEDRTIPGPESTLPVRIYTPEGAGPFQLLVWFHGGGWVVGDLDTADATCRNLAVGAGCVVISVDYRLAPEIKFPGPAEDCYAATRWVEQNAASINVDPGRIAVGGDSAGGNLAAAVSLMARDRGASLPIFQLLVYPVTDRNFDTQSYVNNSEGYQLTRDGMLWYWDHYLKDDADAFNPYAAPLQASDLSGLPPALVITAEYDPLRDEGEAYGRRLEAAGVPTVCKRYDGMIHGFFGMAAVLDKGKQAVEEASSTLQGAFAGQPITTR
jgi:acetyl esterase